VLWTLAQFPELDHLDPAARAQLLRRVPWWTYPLIVVRAVFGAGLLAGIAAGIVLQSFEPQVTAAALAAVAVTVAVWFYVLQLRRLRIELRKEVAERFRGQRPPFCFECGYDLRGLTMPSCPECGKPVVAGPA